MSIDYIETSEEDLDQIAPLWEKLNGIHCLASPFFSDEYENKTFHERKKELLEKAESGCMTLFLAKDRTTEALVGYCVCSVNHDAVGEVDSIYVDEAFRKHHIGNTFLSRAEDFFKKHSAKKQILQVYAGNEKVIEFYKKQGYYPKYITLEKKV